MVDLIAQRLLRKPFGVAAHPTLRFVIPLRGENNKWNRKLFGYRARRGTEQVDSSIRVLPISPSTHSLKMQYTPITSQTATNLQSINSITSRLFTPSRYRSSRCNHRFLPLRAEKLGVKQTVNPSSCLASLPLFSFAKHIPSNPGTLKGCTLNSYTLSGSKAIRSNKEISYVDYFRRVSGISHAYTATLRCLPNGACERTGEITQPIDVNNNFSELSGAPVNTRTIVITSGKGGVGKTTATANLGMSIARLGYRVALVDADIGLRNLDLLLGLENRVLYTAMDILEGQCRLDQALIRDKRWKNLSLLSISKNRQRYNVTRKNMERLITSVCSLGYHFVIIDCPAGIDVGFINAISPAQEALVVTTPEITAIRDADRVAGLLEANGVYDVKLLVNRVRPEMIQRNDMMSVRDVQEMLGIPLLGGIPEDSHVIVSTNRGEPLVLKRKLTLSGIAFENAARRLIGKQDYFIDLKSPYKGIFHKMQHILFGA